jgi:hypothetical protein
MDNNKKIDSQHPVESLLTIQNIQYLVQGLDILLETGLDGERRARVIRLRDLLNGHINIVFDNYCTDHYTVQ